MNDILIKKLDNLLKNPTYLSLDNIILILSYKDLKASINEGFNIKDKNNKLLCILPYKEYDPLKYKKICKAIKEKLINNEL